MMKLQSVFAGAMLACLSFSLSWAQSANISADLEAALSERERVRVIVEFDIPQLAFDGADGLDENRRFLQMDARRDSIIARALGSSADALSAAPVAIDRPSISHEYRYIPAAAMYLDADEVAALLRDPNVVRVVLDRVSAPHLDTSIGLVGARNLHTSGLSGQGVSVAVMDSGVDMQHPMFAGRILDSACFSTADPASNATGYCPNGLAADTTSDLAGDNCNEVADDPVSGADGCSHGTHVAGIAVGADFAVPDDPSVSLRGMAPGANLIAVTVFHRLNSAQDCAPNAVPCVRTRDSDQLAALEWLYENRVAFNLASINMSLGGGQRREACNEEAIAPIISRLRAAGVATVIATGNNGYANRVGSPSCISDAISVGSSTDADTISLFSNSATLLDLLAPGTGINSAYPAEMQGGAPRARVEQGTSMAAPHVAGAWALLRAAHPNTSVDAIENALEATGVVLPIPRVENAAPRIQVDAAHAQLSAHGTGAVGDLTVTPLQAMNVTVTQASPITSLGAAHTLRNTGNSAIIWQATSNADWIRFSENAITNGDIISQSSETLDGLLQPGQSTTLFVAANGTGKAAGAYQSRYQISTRDNAGSMRIAARLTVQGAPNNDNFAAASEIVGFTSTSGILSQTTAATTETGEPNHGQAGTGASIWYRWTAPVSGSVFLQAVSPSFQPVVAAYTGSSVGGLSAVPITANDGPNGIAFNAVAGTTYQLAVAGISAAAGEVIVIVYPFAAPANDAAENAVTLTGSSGRITATNLRATLEEGEPTERRGASVWYRWTAPASGRVWFDPTVAPFPVVFALYDTNFNLLGGVVNDLARFEAVSGQTYLFAVDGLDGRQGVFDLSWAMTGHAGHRLVTSVLPTVRTGQVGMPTTAFATMINPAGPGIAGQNCRLEAPPEFNGDFDYQTTDPATNSPTGQANTPVSLAPGGIQTFVFALTPSLIAPAGILRPIFLCDNIASADQRVDTNTLRFSADAYRNVDVAAIASTIGNTGSVEVPLNSGSAFSIAVQNVGVGGSDLKFQFLVSDFNTHTTDNEPVPISPQMPLQLRVCETNPATGQCLSPPTTSRPRFSLANGQTRTFTVFVRGQGIDVANDPRSNRIVVLATDDESNIFGGTSVAVRTTGN